MLKKANNWISSSFDDFGLADDLAAGPSKASRKRRRDEESKGAKISTSQPAPLSRQGTAVLPQNLHELWVDKYTPKAKEELAVHKKKVADVESWLQTHLKHSKHGSQLLLLTGPAGSGKTATVKTLARHLQLELQEWSNPLTESYAPSSEFSAYNPIADFVPVGGRTSESQATQFKDFLLRANKYCSLSLSGETTLQKLLLVEEFPNAFFRDAQQFHAILRDFVQTSQCPLVFILSDNAGGESNERFLFPRDIQMQLRITNISFNPVASGMMQKVLQRIVNTESLSGGRLQAVSKPMLESLASSSNGDIRAAINALQFSCGGVKKINKKSTKQNDKGDKNEKTDGETNMAAIGAKDTSMFLFRALGKILYCKRGPKAKDHPKLPCHLKQHDRDPLLFNPEEVLEKAQVSGDFFVSFLHENYMEFFQSIEDVIHAADYLSDADYLTVDWANRAVLQEYAACVATRGLLHSNTARSSSTSGSSGLGWKPLHKPQCYAITRKRTENVNIAKVYFRGRCQTPVELQTQYIPYLSILNRKTLNSAQDRFVQDIGNFRKARSHNRYSGEKLDEKDVAVEQDEEDVEAVSGIVEETGASSEQMPKILEEDVVIEDYDSD